MPSERPYLVPTGDTPKTKLHKPHPDKHTSPQCNPSRTYRRVSETVGKLIIGVNETEPEKNWKCLKCYFKTEINYGKNSVTINTEYIE